MTVDPTINERPTAQAAAVDAARVWADSLIDKTGRNELLYCKDRGKIRLDGADPVAVTRLVHGEPVRLRQLFRDEAAYQSVAKTAESIRRRIKEYDEERGVRIGRLVYGFATWDGPPPKQPRDGGPVSPAPATPEVNSAEAAPAAATTSDAGSPDAAPPDAASPDAASPEAETSEAETSEASRSDGTPTESTPFATWRTDGARREVRAPVLLRDITITHRPGRDDFDLRADRDAEISPVLLHYLRSTFGVDIDPDLIADLNDVVDDPERITEALDKLAGLLVDAPEFRIVPGMLIGTFHYAKLAMHQDLLDNAPVFAANGLVSALAGDLGAIERIRRPVGEVTIDLPDRTPPADEFLVLDADPSQNYVVNAALAGRNLVVQGPPGTGKSQTISNLIATFAANGRSVLFVAEKRAAIDAVLGRLTEAGLDDLVLDLHVTTANRSKAYEQFRGVIERARTVDAVDGARLHARLDRTRAALLAHDEAMHSMRTPWGLSVHDLQSAMLEAPPEATPDLRLTAATLDGLGADRADQVRVALAELIALGGLAPAQSRGPWANAQFQSDAAATRAREAVDEARGWLPQLRERSAEVAQALGFADPATPAEAGAMTQICLRTAAAAARWRPEIYDEDLERLVAAVGGAPVTRPGGRIGWWERRRLRKRAKALRLRGMRGDLAAELKEVASVAAEWWRISRVRPPAQPDLSALAAANDAMRTLLVELGGLLAAGDLAARDWPSLSTMLDELARFPNAAHAAARINRVTEQLRGSGIGDLLDWLARVAPTWPEERRTAFAIAAFDHVWHRAVFERVALGDAHLASFDGTAHSAIADDFIATDHAHAQTNRARVRRRVAERLTEVRTQHVEQDIYLSRELTKKRRLKPLRDLVRDAPEVLLAAKPCWAMSPLLVSQLLPPGQLFDVVVFDEASQVQPAEALPSMARARAAVIAGDSKQLPPTAFFEAAVDVEDEVDRDLLTQDAESLLDAFNRALGPELASEFYLGWHYRSRDARLIAPSNAFFYGGRMVTFPGTAVEPPIRFVEVVGAESAEGTSAAEVRRVVDLIIEHARERPSESLGVITMGITHATRIEDALHQRLRTVPELSDWFDGDGFEPFFVKNLERVQGDERDAIILAIGYGKSQGRMMHRFGPLNNAGGERRLNVAITRAKHRMTVVAGFRPDEVEASKLRSEGAQRLVDFLRYAASGATVTPTVADAAGSPSPAVAPDTSPDPAVATVGTVPGVTVPGAVPPGAGLPGAVVPGAAADGAGLTPFAADARRRLAAVGIDVACHVGVAGYFVEVAALHPTSSGRMVMAIESDGLTYHGAPTTRSRDRLRPEQLERLGWRFHRVWSTDWVRNPDRELAKIRAAYEEAVYAADRADGRATPDTLATTDAATTDAAATDLAATDLAATDAATADAAKTGTVTPGTVTTGTVTTGDDEANGAEEIDALPPEVDVLPSVRRSPRPAASFGAPITEISDDELVAIVEWIESDGQLRTDAELKREARDELGLRRNGARIERRLSAAIDTVHARRAAADAQPDDDPRP
ncbi:MAG TPA: AAA domain-containing protein [Micromonosporaceae bacterium]|nr:AAA domain-containing protein [Micromonosporaceae bacterium]